MYYFQSFYYFTVNKPLRSSAKEGYYHSSVFDMAERLYLYADPYFNSSYDYYFTGGNLCILPNSANIIHAGGEQLREMSKFFCFADL